MDQTNDRKSQGKSQPTKAGFPRGTFSGPLRHRRAFTGDVDDDGSRRRHKPAAG